MKIKFIGVPGEQHDSIHMYGQDFPLGEAVEVTDPQAVYKLSKHPHFAHKVEPITPAEDKAQLEELQTLAAAALEPVEAAKADTPQPDTQEADHGDAQPVGNEGAAAPAGGGSQRSAGPRGPGKSR